jgi:hypothetical protein
MVSGRALHLKKNDLENTISGSETDYNEAGFDPSPPAVLYSRGPKNIR